MRRQSQRDGRWWQGHSSGADHFLSFLFLSVCLKIIDENGNFLPWRRGSSGLTLLVEHALLDRKTPLWRSTTWQRCQGGPGPSPELATTCQT